MVAIHDMVCVLNCVLREVFKWKLLNFDQILFINK